MITVPSFGLANHRFLNHRSWNGVLDGKDLNLRAKRNEDGLCIEYKETLYQHFGRVGQYFDPGPKQVIDPPNDLDLTLALDLYGLSRQALYGDQKAEYPGIWAGFEANYKWDAWESYKGWNINSARQKFINIGEPLLKERGVDLRDPKEPGPYYYEGCYGEEEGEEATTSANGEEAPIKKLVLAKAEENPVEDVALDQSELMQSARSLQGLSMIVLTILIQI